MVWERSTKEQPKNLRPSGYVSRWEELWYGLSGPFYDILTWWCFLPLGGEAVCRKEFIRWCSVQRDHRVLSLCCGTGTTERTLLGEVPGIRILAIDLGTGQIATARRKDPSGQIEYRIGNAANTALPAGHFDRVLITLALHEMHRELRLDVLKEARRVCKATGQIIAIEHARPHRWPSRFLRHLWWFYWLPGNPEWKTTMDLQTHGLDTEMEAAGLEVLNRYTTQPDWLEGVVAIPRLGSALE